MFKVSSFHRFKQICHKTSKKFNSRFSLAAQGPVRVLNTFHGPYYGGYF